MDYLEFLDSRTHAPKGDGIRCDNWRPPADGEDFNTAFGMSGKPPAFLVSPAGSVHCFYPPGDTAVRPQDSVHKAMVRVGKRAAGRQLDGHEHSEWPA